jgi:hypothetical protein
MALARNQRHDYELKCQTNIQRSRRGIGRRPVFELLEERRLLALVTWDGGAGDNLWNSFANWSGDVLPTSEDDVVVPASGPSSIVLQGTGATIKSLDTDTSLVVNAPLTVTGGTQVSGSVMLSASTMTLGGQNTLGDLFVSAGGQVNSVN